MEDAQFEKKLQEKLNHELQYHESISKEIFDRIMKDYESFIQGMTMLKEFKYAIKSVILDINLIRMYNEKMIVDICTSSTRFVSQWVQQQNLKVG
jgi:hypothetical protein